MQFPQHVAGFMQRHIQAEGAATQGSCPFVPIVILTGSGVEASDCLCANELKCEEEQLDPQLIRHHTHTDFINWINNNRACWVLNHLYGVVFFPLNCSPLSLYAAFSSIC